MSDRVWIVPVGEQPGAIVGPLATLFQRGDALHFLASSVTSDCCPRIADVLARRLAVLEPQPRVTLLGSTEVSPDVVLRESQALVGNRAHVLVLANGGPKEWLFPILAALQAGAHSHEVVFSQGAWVTRALALPSGKWKTEHQPVDQLSREELLELLGLRWDPGLKVLTGANGGELRMARLEAHYNQLYAQVQATTHGDDAQDRRKAALGRRALALLGLEPRRVLVTGFKSLEDGHPAQLGRLGITAATEADGQAAASRFFARARKGEIRARAGGNPLLITRGTHLEKVVGVLPIGSKSGGVIKQMAALLERGASSLLIIADGADVGVVNHVEVLASLLGKWRSVAGKEANDITPFRVLWVQRESRTGMDTWKRADSTIPCVQPEALQAALQSELRNTQKVIVHLKPADKYLSWAMWQALQQLAREGSGLVVDSTFELSALDAPVVEQMKLQSAVPSMACTPIRGVFDLATLPVDELDQWLWCEASRAFRSCEGEAPEAAAQSVRKAPQYSEWLARNGLGTVDVAKAGDLFEHVLQVRLRMVLSPTKSGILFDVTDAPSARRASGDNQMDVITVQAGTFVVWEAKCAQYKPRPAWQTTLTKAHRYTTCAPDRTHAVVVVPRMPKSAIGYEVDNWGILHIDFRVLEDEAALRALATTGSVPLMNR